MSEQLGASYLLGDVIGRGGMGVVYSATQRALDRRVAVKVPHPELVNDPFVLRRFKTEALAGAKLTHRNIARVIDFGGGDSSPYIVMEQVDGTPLDKIVADTGALATSAAADVSRQILSALEAAHTAGIIHADIKTANVLVETLASGELFARVIDFGLAHFTNRSSHFDVRVLSGTPDYLAPELIQGGTPTVASDIYAVGVVLYELLTGSTPFSGGSSAEIMSRQVEDRVVPPTLRCPEHDIPDDIEDAVMRALAKDPAARFATAVEFAEALRVQCVPARTLLLPRRIAQGTLPAVLTAETATRNWQRDRLIHAFDPVASASARLARNRVAVTSAVADGHGDTIVAAYLDLVRSLVDGSDLPCAAAELEYGIAMLRLTANPADRSPPMWRLQLCLAALYSGLGENGRARDAARVGRDDAVRAASYIGEDRAVALLARLSRAFVGKTLA